MSLITFKQALSRNRIYLLVILTLFFFLFKTSIPFLKYPLVLFFFYLVFSIVLNLKKSVLFGLKNFIRAFYLPIILLSFIILSLAFSNKFSLLILKDTLNTIILFSVFFIMFIYVKNINSLKSFIDLFIGLLIAFAVINSFIEIGNIFNIFSSDKYSKLIFNSDNLSNISQDIDNNFGILPVILGILSIFYLQRKNMSLLKRILCNLLILFLSFAVVLSGSRRAVISLFIIVGLSFAALLISQFSKNSYILKLKTIVSSFLLTVIAGSLFVFFIVTKISYDKKNLFLEVIGVHNILDTKIQISVIVLKYITAVKPDITYYDIYNYIWTPKFNPYDPESSWGTRLHKIMFPLIGENKEIVPTDAKGYLMDSTCNASYYKLDNLCESYSLLRTVNSKDGAHIKASIFCFVSLDFDGNSAFLTVGDVSIKDNLVTGKTSDYYDMNKKGYWQKLNIDFFCKSGEIPIFASFVKRNVSDFSNLEGNIVFAYPQVIHVDENIKSIEPDTFGNKKLDTIVDSKEVSFKYFEVVKKTEIELKYRSESNYSNLFAEASLMPNTNNSVRKDSLFLSLKSFLKNYMSELLMEDTSYIPLKNEFIINQNLNLFAGDRLLRWKFAILIYFKEYTSSERIFGGGFKHLKWYGYYFLNDKTKSDWPHNPFLSILLYSGILGLLIYCFFLYKVFYYYFKYIKEYPLLFIFFLITFFFSFFSGGSPFDPPIMGFFSILPFFIHSVYKRDESQKLPDNLD